jgi:hypothetical protein
MFVLQGVLHPVKLQSWLHNATHLYARQVVLSNISAQGVKLLHIGLYPNSCGHYMLLDDHGLSCQLDNGQREWSDLDGDASDVCVLIQPGMSPGS